MIIKLAVGGGRKRKETFQRRSNFTLDSFENNKKTLGLDLKHAVYLPVDPDWTQTQFRVNAAFQGAASYILLPVSHYRPDVIKVS